MKRKPNELSIDDAIRIFLEESHLIDDWLIWKTRNHWEEFAGKAIADQTTQIWFKDGTLFVEIKSPVWKNELMYQKDALRESINQKAGKEFCLEVKVL